MAEDERRGVGAGGAWKCTAAEIMAVAAELIARAEARIGPPPVDTGGIEGSRAAAEWRAKLFEEMASLAT